MVKVCLIADSCGSVVPTATDDVRSKTSFSLMMAASKMKTRLTLDTPCSAMQ